MSRRSRQKEAIIAVLRGTDIHPDAEWIYEQVKKQIPSISLGTVYRNLKKLKEEGLVREVKVTPGLSRYDMVPRYHYHFRCEICGRIYDLDESLVDKSLEERIAEKTGFKVTGHAVELNVM
ncbi:MAG: transcriptional repressor, partial [Dehalococcoidales bacterium]|nr:transcriptional repressor [Dehalococcoidales bacterium]